ncbi:hypothetical protein FI667_g9191, partial [Globisporangium splendens]
MAFDSVQSLLPVACVLEKLAQAAAYDHHVPNQQYTKSRLISKSITKRYHKVNEDGDPATCTEHQHRPACKLVVIRPKDAVEHPVRAAVRGFDGVRFAPDDPEKGGQQRRQDDPAGRIRDEAPPRELDPREPHADGLETGQ